MKIRLTLWPGQKGTKKLQTKYGEQLVCVRYRYDAERYRRYKTVELIEEETVWAPDLDKVVSVRVEWDETRVQTQVKKAGGVWNAEQKVWKLALSEVLALGLVERIVAREEGI